jgi:uncharacterized OB-fold protein/acyl dehydratase
VSAEEAIREAAARLAAAGRSRPRAARDPVNLPMIRNWLEALGGGGPADPEPDTAPPAMIQVWTMPGLHGVHGDDDPLGQMVAVLDEAGYTSVVATNCDQTYQRYLKLGEQLSVRARLLDVTGPKRTALGEGWFVTTRSTWFSAGEPVATMDFRVLKFKPAPSGSTSIENLASPMRPQVTPDTAFFWAGTAAGELRIQRCASCGALRHPPGPMCPACGAPGDGGYVVAAGTGEVFSYVVHRHPPVPGKKLPMVVALVQLPEGVRMVGEMPGVRPDLVRIGLPVRATFVRIGDDLDPLALPAWLPLPGGTTVPAHPGGTPSSRTPRADPPARRAEGMLPDRVIDVTPTFVVASALATRDFYVVHHDRDRALAQGARDIFVNILTTIGLVQRYVCDWAPDAVVRAVSIRLGVPCHAGDTLTLTGQVAPSVGAEQVISVTGRCGLGDHVTGTVRIERPR